MKMFYRILVANFALCLLFSLCSAQENGNPSSIPANLWELHPEGVAVALTLETHIEKKEKKSSLKIHFKNTSSEDVAITDDAVGSGFKVFTLDTNGKWKPLRDYDAVVTTKLTSVVVKPGETIIYPLELNQSELNLIKSREVKCRIGFFSRATNRRPSIESSPRTLTETVSSNTTQ